MMNAEGLDAAPMLTSGAIMATATAVEGALVPASNVDIFTEDKVK